MTQKQLEKLKDKWAKRLKVRDWEIEVGFVDGFDNIDAQGCTMLVPRHKHAEILLNKEYAKDFEATLVHELLHVVFPYTSEEFCDIDAHSVFGEEVEQGIEMLAQLLVKWDNGVSNK